jgi:hypothetical protein
MQSREIYLKNVVTLNRLLACSYIFLFHIHTCLPYHDIYICRYEVFYFATNHWHLLHLLLQQFPQYLIFSGFITIIIKKIQNVFSKCYVFRTLITIKVFHSLQLNVFMFLYSRILTATILKSLTTDVNEYGTQTTFNTGSSKCY